MQIFKNYGLSITLCALFLSSWAGQAYFQWNHFISEQEAHKQPVLINDFLNSFMQSTLENWQSEFLQLLTFVLLTAYLIHKGSHESKDSDEEMKKMLLNIQKKLDNKRK